MAANLTPQYKEAELRFREAVDPAEKLAAMREMFVLLPKHKGTEKMQADHKRRIKELEELASKPKKSGGPADPGHVRHEGAGQWVLVGPPNAGKSALVKALTHATPEVAAYPFTTRAPLSGMMPFEDAMVQLVDTPAVTTTHGEVWMTNLVRNADGILLVLDVAGDDVEDGIKGAFALFEKARIHPASRPLPEGASPFLVQKPVFVALNKIDLDPDGMFSLLAVEALGEHLQLFQIAAEHGTGLEALREALFRELHMIRIYTKEPGKKPDLEKPFLLPEGSDIEDLALQIHKDVAARFKSARIWGSGAFPGQQVDRTHALRDKDVVEIHAP